MHAQLNAFAEAQRRVEANTPQTIVFDYLRGMGSKRREKTSLHTSVYNFICHHICVLCEAFLFLNNPNNYNQEDMKNIRNHILLEE
jgi:hypothetical protein